jgi:L-lactate dehydrogenase complex protein LldF
MSQAQTPIDFRHNTQNVIPRVRAATQKNTRTAVVKRLQAVEQYGAAEFERLRQAGHDLRLHALMNLAKYLPMVEAQVIAAGGQVHWANDAEEANRIVVEIARAHNVKRITKVKSMLSEEIGMNDVLRDEGITAFETDLGEYIVQLEGSHPSHMTAPAMHLTKETIADLFREKLGVDAPPDPAVLTEIARGKLREEFLVAEMGISGGNFLIAETGTLVLVTNEGNGRMCTTLPPVHVAVVGIEKIIPDWESLGVMLNLLARSTTGQSLTSYTTCITGTRDGGPREFHLVLLDNGRTRILSDARARETLLCIRCGACQNACPVFSNVGGHAYGAIYSGPIGAILSPQLLGTKLAGNLPFASSLCGACAEVCPVKIPIPEILLYLRHRVVEGDAFAEPAAPQLLRTGVSVGMLTMRIPWIYEFGTQLLKYVQLPFKRGDWLPVLPQPLNRWTMTRPLPAFSADFRDWMRNRTPEGRAKNETRKIGIGLFAIGVVAAFLVLARKLWRAR